MNIFKAQYYQVKMDRYPIAIYMEIGLVLQQSGFGIKLI